MTVFPDCSKSLPAFPLQCQARSWLCRAASGLRHAAQVCRDGCSPAAGCSARRLLPASLPGAARAVPPRQLSPAVVWGLLPRHKKSHGLSGFHSVLLWESKQLPKAVVYFVMLLSSTGRSHACGAQSFWPHALLSCSRVIYKLCLSFMICH